jgi:hypothetical protein
VAGWLRRRPWLWIVVLYLVVVAVNVAFVLVAQRNAPEPAEGAPAGANPYGGAEE